MKKLLLVGTTLLIAVLGVIYILFSGVEPEPQQTDQAEQPSYSGLGR